MMRPIFPERGWFLRFYAGGVQIWLQGSWWRVWTASTAQSSGYHPGACKCPGCHPERLLHFVLRNWHAVEVLSS